MNVSETGMRMRLKEMGATADQINQTVGLMRLFGETRSMDLLVLITQALQENKFYSTVSKVRANLKSEGLTGSLNPADYDLKDIAA